ncbi:MAG TPA: glycosyltransferase family 39 protein [Bacteroidota bacterium]|nr:glycosyltransferase family 39 protein [Bacteroidota bacterium]
MTRWTAPALIAGLAASLALAFALVIYPAIREPFAANIDPDKLGDLASNIASGQGFVYSGPGKLVPEFDRGPVYPAIVAGIMTIGGTRSFIPVQVFQCVVHGLTCFLGFLAASRIHARKIALASEALCAVHPMLLWYTARIWIETVHTFLVTAALLALLLLAARPTRGRSFLAGVIMGVTTLTKSVILPFSAVAAVLVLRRAGKEAVPAAAILLVTCLLVVVPWTLRNYVESGYVVPVHTSLGLNRVQGDAIGMYWSRMPFSTLDLWMLGKERIDSLLEGTGATPVDPAGDRILAASSFRMSLSDPVFAVKRTAINLLTFCYMSESRPKSIFLACIQIPLFLCALAGSWRLRKSVPEAETAILLFLYFLLVHAFIVGWARYSVPVVPAAIVLAAGIFPLRKKPATAEQHA